MKPSKKVVLLHDICGVGKAALTNMLPILGVMGIEACPLPTMLLSTHTGGYGVPAISKVPVSYIKASADHYVREGVTFDLIFIGYLGSVEMVDAVRYFISRFPDVPVVMDPIMGDHGTYYSNFDHVYGQAVRQLLAYADIILPNITEGCLLTDTTFSKNYEDVRLADICRNLSMFGAKSVVITSVSLENNEKGIAIYENQQITIQDGEYLPCEYHGSGDAFDGVFVGMLLKGMPIVDCVKHAHEFVCACIKESSKHTYNKREGLMIEKNLHMLV